VDANRTKDANKTDARVGIMHNAPRVFPSAIKKEKSEEHGEDKAVKWSDSKPPFNGMNVLPVKQKLTLLPIVPVIIRSPDNKTIQTYALLDCASEITLLREDARKSLSLSGPEQLVEIGTWHSQDPKFKSCMVSFSVESVDGLSKFEITDAYSVPRLNLNKRPVPFDKVVQKWPHLAVVPLSCVNAGEVKLLIGMDHSDPHDILEYRKDPVLRNAPKAILTAFGWAIQGNIGPAVRGGPDARCCALSLQTHQDDLFNAVNQFLLQEEYGASPDSKPAVGKEVLRSRRIFLEETTRYVEEQKRYEAGVLWAKDDAVLPDNRQGALERFKRTMKRLSGNQESASVIYKEMEQNFSLGFAEKVPDEVLKKLLKGRTWFLPWHPVAHPHKKGKWRLVFDAAAEFKETSLNHRLLKGGAKKTPQSTFSCMPQGDKRSRTFAA
jgi:hypothetical protein